MDATTNLRRAGSTTSLSLPASAAAIAGIATVSATADSTRYDDSAFHTIAPSNFVVLDSGNAFVLLDNGTAIVLRHDQFGIDAAGNLIASNAAAVAEIANTVDQATVSNPSLSDASPSVVQHDFTNASYPVQLDPAALGELNATSLRMQAAVPIVKGTATSTVANTLAGAGAGAGIGAAALPIAATAFVSVTGTFSDPNNPGDTNEPIVPLAPTPPPGPASLSGFVVSRANIDGLGAWVSSAGDINNDDFDDVIFSTYDAEVYVMFGMGGAYSASFNLEDLNGANGFAMTNLTDAGLFQHVASYGDIDGDTVDDIIIGEPEYNSYSGQAHVLFGRNSKVGETFPDKVDLSSPSDSNKLIISTANSSSLFGYKVSGRGDVNGDGLADIVLTTPFDNSGNGVTYVVLGSDNALAGGFDISSLNGVNGFEIYGDSLGQFASLGSADLNNDNYDDILLTDRNNGQIYVVFGKTNTDRLADPDYNADGNGDGHQGDRLDITSLDGSNGFTINGLTVSNNHKYIAYGGDINNDDIDDIIIGDETSNSAGKVYVVFGKETDETFGTNLDLSLLNGDDGFVIDGFNANDKGGASVASAGDVNRDGVDDILIGAPSGDPDSGRGDAGQSYVVFGKKTDEGGKFPATFSLSSLDGTNGFMINGIGAGDRSGASVSSAGDMNGDGYADILIGAPNNGASPGESYVIFGMETFNAVVELDALPGLA